MVSVLFDTTVFSDSLNERQFPNAKSLMRAALEGRIKAGYSLITAVELLKTPRLNAEHQLEYLALLETLTPVPLTLDIAVKTGIALRSLSSKSQRRHFRDAVIAFTAQSVGVPAYTRVVRGFRRFATTVLTY